MQNTAYSDAGSFVLDANNTSYQGTVYSNSSSLNASLLGIHLISYSADADQAGNIPDNKTRTVTVFNTDPYTISSLNTTSNNPNSHYAKVGDNIIISLQADKLIQNANVTIDNQQAIPYIDGNNLIANLTIHENTTNGNVAFNITLIDVLTATQISELNLTDSNVYIDTMSPIITISPENVTIERGMEYVDTGATISDNDPAYNGTISSNATRLDTNIPGEHIISYQATNDAAGNEAANATRLVTVLYTAPSQISASIKSNNTDTMRAKAGDMLNITLTANKPISHAEGTIMGRMADTIIQNDTVHTTIIIKQEDVNGNATFSITIYDDFSNFTSNETTLDSANVLIDTVIPTKTSLTIYSNNSNTSRAKAGDVLNITLVTDERISDARFDLLKEIPRMLYKMTPYMQTSNS